MGSIGFNPLDGVLPALHAMRAPSRLTLDSTSDAWWKPGTNGGRCTSSLAQPLLPHQERDTHTTFDIKPGTVAPLHATPAIALHDRVTLWEL